MPTSTPPQPTPPPAVAASVTIEQSTGFAGSVKLDILEQASFTATVRDASGAVLTGHAITWSSSSPNVATVSSTGTVIGMGRGSTTITATSDGKSDTRTVQVVPLNLSAFQVSVAVTDDAGNPVPGASVETMYYGPRPSGCFSCNIPYGSIVTGSSDGSGLVTAHFVAAPEAMDEFAGAPNAFAYLVTSSPNFETDRRFVVGATPPFSEPVHLHPMRELTTGDSAAVTIASTDPVYQELDTTPASFATTVCRSVRLRVTTSGVLSVNVVAADAGSPPFVEIDRADESDVIAFGNGVVSQSVHAGDVVEVRIAATIRPGDPNRSFVLHTSVTQ
jgi:hypothetical protein